MDRRLLCVGEIANDNHALDNRRMTMAVEHAQEQSGTLTRTQPGSLSTPFSLMRRLSDDMERIFEDTWGMRPIPQLFRRLEPGERRWTPGIEAFERKGEFVVRAELPGLSRENVKVEVADNQLIIEGERKEEKEQKEKGYYACERSYGAFYRALPLPDGVKTDEAKASFKDGVLEITMPAPKLPEKHGRRLEIK
jgi:HSP20 family protein